MHGHLRSARGRQRGAAPQRVHRRDGAGDAGGVNSVAVIRGGKRATVTVQVTERPTEEALAKLSGGATGDAPAATPLPTDGTTPRGAVA